MISARDSSLILEIDINQGGCMFGNFRRWRLRMQVKNVEALLVSVKYLYKDYCDIMESRPND